VYCCRSCLFVCNGRAGGRAGRRCVLCVCGSVTTMTELEIACIDLHRTGSVDEGSDHLQLIKFGRPAPPGRGSMAGRNVLAPAYLLHAARSVCVSLSVFFFITTLNYNITKSCARGDTICPRPSPPSVGAEAPHAA